MGDVRSLGEVNKGLQAIAAEVTGYSKKAVEDSMRAFEQLIDAKSLEQAIEIQSQYTKKAYDAYMAEMSKLGEMYVGLAKNAYKPVEFSVGQEDGLTSLPNVLPTKRPGQAPGLAASLRNGA